MLKSIRTYAMGIPLSFDFPTSYKERFPTQHVFVEIEDDQGTVGYGEGAALPWFTGETAATMKTFLDTVIIPKLEGLALDEAYQVFEGLSHTFPVNTGAKEGMEMALLDLIARLESCPFYSLIGRRVNDELDTVFFIGAVELDSAIASVNEGLKKGFIHFKLKADGKIHEDATRIKSVLETLPNDATLRIDANCGWQRYSKAKSALSLIGEDERIEYIEQPVLKTNFEDLKALSKSQTIPIFADESAMSVQDVIRLVSENIVDGICIKLTKLGGLRNAKLVADIARAAYLPVTIISAFEASLGAMANIHLAATISNLMSATELLPWWLNEDPVNRPLRETPVIKIQEAIGLGLDLVQEKLVGNQENDPNSRDFS